MVTGIEAAVGPAVGRALGSALGKIAAIPVGALSTRWRNRKTRAALAKATQESIAVHLSPEQAKNLSDFLDSPDFGAISLSVATQVFASAGTKAQKKELESAHQALKQLVRLHVVDSEKSLEIAEAVWQSLNSKCLESVEKIKLGETLNADTRASLVRLAACFSAAETQSSESLSHIASLTEYLTFERQLADQVRSLHASMALPHAGTTRKVPYSKLFVEPRLQPLHTPETGEIPQIELRDALANSHRVVILGDPGGGKSTLSLKLAYDVARHHFPAVSARVPFLFILRDHVDAFKHNGSTMSQLLEAICRSPYNVDPPDGAVDYLLSTGRAMVIFDGLDELTETSLRRKVVEFVESFVYKYPSAPVMVTSRRVGYNEAPLDEALFTAVSLAELDEEQVKSYATKWFALEGSVERKRRSELANSFIYESQFVADLRKNPLMLSLMCGIYASEHYIPSNRPDVYKKCAELLFERWDKQRGIVIPLPFNAHVRQALNALALEMYTEPSAQQGLTRERLVRFMTGFLVSKRFEDEAEAEDAADQFVDFCTGRAWVLTDMGSDTRQSLYGFTHRTFLEYFAANQLVRTNPTAENLFDKLHPRIKSAEWEVVGQLALQILGQNVDDGGDEFLTLTLNAIQDTESVSEKINLISYAARSLAFMVPRPQIIQKTCEYAVDLSIEADGSIAGEPTYTSPLSVIAQCSPENVTLVSKYLKESLFSRVDKHPDDERPLRLALSFETLSANIRPYSETLYGQRNRVWEDLHGEILDSLLPLLVRHREREVWAAMLSATLQGWPMREVTSRFGVEHLWNLTKFSQHRLNYPFVLDVTFANKGRRGPFSKLAAEHEVGVLRCLEELAVLLPEMPSPWVSQEQFIDFYGSALVSISDGPVSSKEGPAKEGAILLFLPLSESAYGRSGAGSSWASVPQVTRGRLSRILPKWVHARINPEFRPSALATLRGLQLSSGTSGFIERWIKNEFSTLDEGEGKEAAER